MILTFGSLNADFIFSLEKLPQPGETLLSKTAHMEGGGKGANQAVAAARDGAEVVMVGAVGSDPLREIALQNLKDCDVDISYIKTSALQTGCATVWVDHAGCNQIVVSQGANAEANATQVNDTLLKQANYVLLQMETPPAETEILLKRAKAYGTRTILNLAPAIRLNKNTLSLCSLLVINETEAQEIANWLQCSANAQAIHRILGIDVLRTLGEQGSEVATYEGCFTFPAYPVETVDTTAAGDCFVGVLAATLDRGAFLHDAIHRASMAGALACRRKGSQSSLPWRDEIDQVLAV